MNAAPPERLPAGTGLVSLQEPGVVVQAIAAIEGKKRKPQYKNERDIHRAALDYYFLRGKERRLEEVAEKFKVSLGVVQQWSSSFNWKERVKKFEETGYQAKFDETINRVLALKAQEMLTVDPATGMEVLTREATPEKIKTLIQAKAALREDARKGDPDPSNAGAGPDGSTNGSSKVKGGMMVIVNIKK